MVATPRTPSSASSTALILAYCFSSHRWTTSVSEEATAQVTRRAEIRRSTLRFSPILRDARRRSRKRSGRRYFRFIVEGFPHRFSFLWHEWIVARAILAPPTHHFRWM